MKSVDLEPLGVARELEGDGWRAIALGLEALERKIGRDRRRLREGVAPFGMRRQIAPLEIEIALEVRNLDSRDGRHVGDRPVEIDVQLRLGTAELLDGSRGTEGQRIRREPQRGDDRPIARKDRGLTEASVRTSAGRVSLVPRPLDLAAGLGLAGDRAPCTSCDVIVEVLQLGMALRQDDLDAVPLE